MAVDVSETRTGGRPAFFDRSARRLATETKHSTKSTELYAYIAAVIGVLIASAVIGADDDAGRSGNFGDYFTAYDAWRLIALLTIGYMIARGLAKSGSREPYWQGGSNEETHVERER
ncbi:MAG: hypothetical protein M3304_05590 [Actinomycetota bacterium]|nr:hypothetical protein [Actinomycetota bacterium]